MTNFMSQWVYTPVVKDHFMNPRNTLREDEQFDADGIGNVGSLACGDQMEVLIKVKDDKIADLRWLTYGCASAIASTSMMSEMAIGLTLEQAYHLTPAAITEALGGLPEHKFHCSVLGDKALRAAIDDYLAKQGRENPFKKHVAKTICECKNVTDVQIEDLVKTKQAKTLEQLQEITEYGTVCGKCKQAVSELFDEYKHIYNV
ncbi:MAG: iron-sulfur cluster assembly scaffold protein [Sphaerochaeta sp.]|jgi:nitrogen fixation NifU-like protein|uniref:iron-sulfur cluster assembly scaffold protein n=1 Tax=unclassified Sphaerochaeta TaxID=2637943 RepID=UPI000AD2C63C|nr:MULTISPECIES: iron-sulfur cluster assembly scaffold protein [unclassified Sphaerochaeta]MCK9598369.1 iron-sulfur cluster assembly scaffold protein [Sphaerochaeta sp.]MDX9824428.1 iron-sulfur cluster assembly scaffold protein [Sphaerochaeta sp.]MEA4864874.1 iron-sulfur cluster assembly scaffold protein [Sphaerochaeta sp.]HAP56806.1 iron-sulfur cluster assembly scaffold protein [Sphaerochaeta sp.]HBO36139.1 iron-sulfur cluster assembly scaffold protein [Sphaerochaeta sp.]